MLFNKDHLTEIISESWETEKQHFAEVYGVDVSEGTISNVTNRVLEHVKQWQDRPLEQVYFAVWMDGIVLKVKQNGKYINKCIYLVIGLKKKTVVKKC